MIHGDPRTRTLNLRMRSRSRNLRRHFAIRKFEMTIRARRQGIFYPIRLLFLFTRSTQRKCLKFVMDITISITHNYQVAPGRPSRPTFRNLHCLLQIPPSTLPDPVPSISFRFVYFPPEGGGNPVLATERLVLAAWAMSIAHWHLMLPPPMAETYTVGTPGVVRRSPFAPKKICENHDRVR